MSARLDDSGELPDVVYTNHLVTHFTGMEVVLYGTQVELPISPPVSLKEVRPKVKARWIMPAERYVDHVLRSVKMIQGNPVLKKIADELEQMKAGSLGSEE